LKVGEKPAVINTAKAPTYCIAISELKADGECSKELVHRQAKYLNNLVEADHGKLKQRIKRARGFNTLKWPIRRSGLRGYAGSAQGSSVNFQSDLRHSW